MKLFFVGAVFTLLNVLAAQTDIHIIGYLDDPGSLSTHAESFINCIGDKLPIHFYKTRDGSIKDLNESCKKIAQDAADLRKKSAVKEADLSGFILYVDALWRDGGKYLPHKTDQAIRFAYCVTERTEVPPAWVRLINERFDGILVPDDWLVNVYKKSGVRIPIIVLPLALDLTNLLSMPAAEKNKKFVFGFSGGFWPRKNHELLMKAFAEEFKNDSTVELKVHGRYGGGYEKVEATYKSLDAANIQLLKGVFSRSDYETFLASLDCFVTLSKGEGFSIIPREALAAGIPCIVSNNTAQQTICKTGAVYALESSKQEPSYFDIAGGFYGYHYNTDIKLVRHAMRSVYNNYDHYKELALRGREWVKGFLPTSLSKLYMSLLAPKKVILSHKDFITEAELTVSSAQLFEKYKKVLKSSNTVFSDERKHNTIMIKKNIAPWLSKRLINKIQ